MLLNAIAILCAASAWLVSRCARQHRPVAIALTVCAGLDVLRSIVPMPARVDMALCLGVPAISAWMYGKVFDSSDEIAWVAPVILYAVGCAMILSGPWDAIMPVAYLGAILVAAMAWYSGDRTIEASQRTALMLLAGDVAGLILLCRREWISYQAGAVLGLVALYQVWWLWRSKRGK